MVKRSTRGKKGKNTVSVDFTNSEVRTQLPENDYMARLASLTHDPDMGDAGKVVFEYEVTQGPKKGKKVKQYCDLSEGSLWKLRNQLEDHGYETEQKSMDLDLDEIKDQIGDEEFGIVVSHRQYEGKTYQDISVIDASDVEPDEEDEEGDPDTDDEMPEEDEVNEMDEDELEEVVDEHDLDVDLSKLKTIKKKRAAVIEALEEAREEGDEEEGDEDIPDEDEVMEASKSELQEMIEEHDLDVDLSDYRGLKKQRAAVNEALEELREEEEGEEGEEEEGEEGEEEEPDSVDKDEVMGMSAADLKELAEELDLKVKLVGSIRQKRKAMVKALEEADLLES